MPFVDADPDRHGGFIMQSFLTGCGMPKQVLRDLLNGAARACVAVGKNEDLFAGWAAVAGEQEVVWAYVKPIARGGKLMKGMLKHLGVDFEKPIVAMFKSPAVDAWIRRGLNVKYKESGNG